MNIRKKVRFNGETQICNVCGIEKEISKFEWQINRPNPRKTCKLCRSRIRATTPKEKERQRKYKKYYWESGKGKIAYERHKYGISKKEIGYECCAICGSTKRLSIDHDHETGKFRALLCSKCNAGLGMFNENIDKMKNAINYLRYFQKGGSSLKDRPHYEV